MAEIGPVKTISAVMRIVTGCRTILRSGFESHVIARTCRDDGRGSQFNVGETLKMGYPSNHRASVK